MISKETLLYLVCMQYFSLKLTDLDRAQHYLTLKMQLLALNPLQKNKLALTLSKDKQQLYVLLRINTQCNVLHSLKKLSLYYVKAVLLDNIPLHSQCCFMLIMQIENGKNLEKKQDIQNKVFQMSLGGNGVTQFVFDSSFLKYWPHSFQHPAGHTSTQRCVYQI